MRRWVFHIAALLSLLVLVATCVGWAGGIQHGNKNIEVLGIRLAVGQVSGYWHFGEGEAYTTAWFAADWIYDGQVERAYVFFDDCYFGRFRLPGVNLYWNAWSDNDWFLVIHPCMAILLALPLPLFWIWNYWLRHRRFARLVSGDCVQCGYDLQGSAGNCPECGATPRV